MLCTESLFHVLKFVLVVMAWGVLTVHCQYVILSECVVYIGVCTALIITVHWASVLCSGCLYSAREYSLCCDSVKLELGMTKCTESVWCVWKSIWSLCNVNM